MSAVSFILVLMTSGAAAVLLAAAGFSAGWWLRSRVADHIDDEREAVASRTAQQVMVRVLKPGPN